MEYGLKNEKYYDLLMPVISGMGHSIVELKNRIVQGQLHITLVLFNKDGITIDDCAEVYRTVLARIEMDQGNRDVHLEVSSPGLSRNLKTADELEIFAGKGARLLLAEENEWESGILGAVKPGGEEKSGEFFVDLMEYDKTGALVLKKRLPVLGIKKAKLDETFG